MYDPGVAAGDTTFTTDDVSRINKAMKTKEFGNLMQEYMEEISDPKHRDEYDQYMEQLESKGRSWNSWRGARVDVANKFTGVEQY